jgi:adenosylcobinamide-GDP ribazoletransferase
VPWFPLVGAAVALVSGAALFGGRLVAPGLAAAVIALAVEAWLTGALHEDALADCCDGFGGGWTRDDVLRIMRDSRLGTYGTVGLVLFLLLKAALFERVDPWRDVALLAAVGAWSRWAAPALLVLARPTTTSGLAATAAAQLGPAPLLMATVLAAVLSAPWFAVAPVPALASIAVMFLTLAIWRTICVRRLGGATGDCAGAAVCLAQVTMLAVALAPWNR